jgi:Flp pilus assembly protein TadG
MVELALVVGLLLLIMFGIVEFGAAWSNKLKVETGARAGARVGANLGANRLADYSLLQSVKSVLSDIGLNNVQYVVVFKANAASGQPTAASCAAATPTAVSGDCNVYTGAQLQSLTQASFSGTTCASGAPDASWCPTSRKDLQSAGTDYLGVWIRADSPTITSYFGKPLKLKATAVMRIEPK